MLQFAAQAQLIGPSNIDKVKESVLPLDQTRTLVQALELSRCFSETKWSSFTDDKGRDIVQFQGRFNDFGPIAHLIRPSFIRMAPEKECTTFTCGPCTYFIQFAMLKSQTDIPSLGIKGQSFTIFRSWFEAEVAKTAGGITYGTERIRASEWGNDMDALAAGMFGLGGTGLVSPTLQQVYAGSLPNVAATVFTSISAALNKPGCRDNFIATSEEQAAQFAREQEQKAEQERQRRIQEEERRRKDEEEKGAAEAEQNSHSATRISGSIDSRGKASVSALSTPLGRYREAISDAVGSSWYYWIGPRMDLFSIGTIKVIFTIEKDGKARNPRVLSNTSNQSLEMVTIEAINAADIPPIPLDVLPELDGGRIEIDFSFSIISY